MPHDNFMLVGMTAHFLSTVLFKVIIINARDKGLPSQSKRQVCITSLDTVTQEAQSKYVRELLNSETHDCSTHHWEKSKAA